MVCYTSSSLVTWFVFEVLQLVQFEFCCCLVGTIIIRGQPAVKMQQPAVAPDHATPTLCCAADIYGTAKGSRNIPCWQKSRHCTTACKRLRCSFSGERTH